MAMSRIFEHGSSSLPLGRQSGKRHRIRHVCVREIAHQDPDEIFHSGPAHMQARQDFLEKFIVEVRLPLAGFPCGLIYASFKKN